MIIRKLQKKDIATCIHMGARLHEESEYNVLEYSPERCLELGNAALKDEIFWIVAEENSEIMGMLGAYVSPPPFSCEKVANEFLVYVVPEKRGGFVFYRLVSAYFKWAKKEGAKIIFLSNTSGINKEETEELYGRLGFLRVGGIWRYVNG